ncbi:MAG: ATP-binding protein [Spirochaetaceae bacterium]|nr:ATP-binding protein [Spirochaetaceae bacterium]MCF7947644.1 ATP-binding protein [Spirochaetia bacterium]MCF7951382.1 ATP-binding protein [Spirochaetaceae bacterium]
MEITRQLKVDEQHGHMLNNHSVLNVLNVLQYNFLCLSELLQDEKILLNSYGSVQELALLVKKQAIGEQDAEKIAELHSKVLTDVYSTTTKPPEGTERQVREIVEAIEKIVSILDIRLDEIVRRNELGPSSWIDFSPTELYDDFMAFLKAVEQNSRGVYKIVENIALKNRYNYFVDLQFDAASDGLIRMPLLVKDVLRDLIANARKYTDPGGNILSGIYQDQEHLWIVVEDNGRGIPEDSIESVVNFGMRAANVLHKKSYGGGFGLTKAYFITKQFGGRMWIESEENSYTRVTLQIPFEY